MDAGEQKALDDIEAYGCHVIHVLEDEKGPPFSYSVGVQRTSGAPEVMVIGLKRPIAHFVVNEYNRRVRAGERFAPGARYDGFLRASRFSSRWSHPNTSTNTWAGTSGSTEAALSKCRRRGRVDSSELDRLRVTLAQSLPIQVQWTTTDPVLLFDFLPARSQLRSAADILGSGDAESGYAAFFVFGEQYYDGGARPFLCIDSTNGEVHGLDVESATPRFFLNSDVASFVRTFEALDRALRLQTLAITDLPGELRSIESLRYPESEWRHFVEWLAEEGFSKERDDAG